MNEVITRAEALQQGLRHYFTGVPCSKGHVNKRYTVSKTCYGCLSQSRKGKKRVYTEEQKARRRIVEKNRYAKHAHGDKFKEYTAARIKRYTTKLKTELIAAYGGGCTCCGEVESKFLTVDHVNNDGNEHRKTIKNSRQLYRVIRDEGYPNRYTILCFNCNIARSLFKICPHQEARHLSCD